MTHGLGTLHKASQGKSQQSPGEIWQQLQASQGVWWRQQRNEVTQFRKSLLTEAGFQIREQTQVARKGGGDEME